VLRGGSWNNNHGNARCAYRNRNHPNNRNNNVGFRLVVSTLSKSPKWPDMAREGRLELWAVHVLPTEAENGGVGSRPRVRLGEHRAKICLTGDPAVPPGGGWLPVRS